METIITIGILILCLMIQAYVIYRQSINIAKEKQYNIEFADAELKSKFELYKLIGDKNAEIVTHKRDYNDLVERFNKKEAELTQLQSFYTQLRDTLDKKIEQYNQLEKIVNEVTGNETIDLSQYVPFPRNYIIKKEIKCIVTAEDAYAYKQGRIVTIIPDGSNIPFTKEVNEHCIASFELAPLDPKDHPNHPEFKG